MLNRGVARMQLFETSGRTGSNLIAAAVKKGHSILDEIRAQHPGASIFHWLGVHKLSSQLDQEMENLFVQGPCSTG